MTVLGSIFLMIGVLIFGVISVATGFGTPYQLQISESVERKLKNWFWIAVLFCIFGILYLFVGIVLLPNEITPCPLASCLLEGAFYFMLINTTLKMSFRVQ